MKKENKTKKEWDELAKVFGKKLVKEAKWIEIVGRFSSGCVAAGVVLFGLSLFDLLAEGITERFLVAISIAGILLGIGGVVASVIANKLSLMGIITSILFSRIEEKLENIKVVKKKDNSEGNSEE